MAAPTVSVALCTHNGADYIEEQLRSILAQTHPVDEIIVSDDASRDDTIARIRSIVGESPEAPVLRVLLNDSPLGVTRNFEQAVQATTGDLIALCDQDDVWRSDKIAVMVDRFARQPHLSLLFSDAALVDERGESLSMSLFDALEVTAADLAALRGPDAFATLLRRNLVTGATAMFARDLLPTAAPFDPAWVHDEWLAIIAAATGTIDAVPEQLISYRQHGGNQIGVASPTLRYKLRRMLEPRGTRNTDLAQRSAHLHARLDALGVGAPITERARDKAAFEDARARLSPRRLRRIPRVLALARSGDYERFASQGRRDILRDLLQPA